MFSAGFRAGHLDENSFFADTATKGSPQLFRDKAPLLGSTLSEIRATPRWLEVISMEEMDVGLRFFGDVSLPYAQI